MSDGSLLFNLLPYRPAATGLSRYAERLLLTWPQRPLPLQLRLTELGSFELSRSPQLPLEQRHRGMRWLQRQAMVQHVLPLRRLLRDHWPERIYSPYTDWLRAFPDLPQVITCHDLIPLHFPNSSRAYWRSRFWLSAQFHRAAMVVAISRAVADQLIGIGLPASRITIVPNGVESVVDPIHSPLSRDCLVLARHAPHKNVALALNGFAALLARCPTWPGRLVVIGDRGRCSAALQRQERELGMTGRVCWLPTLLAPALEVLMRNSFCLISPSLMEGFDYPLLEAQALGLPTLASRIPVHEELHQDAALLFELDDQGDTMACLLQRLDREPALWRQLSQAGLRNAVLNTSQRQAVHLQQLLQAPLP